jgi:hypothetical protein
MGCNRANKYKEPFMLLTDKCDNALAHYLKMKRERADYDALIAEAAVELAEAIREDLG